MKLTVEFEYRAYFHVTRKLSTRIRQYVRTLLSNPKVMNIAATVLVMFSRSSLQIYFFIISVLYFYADWVIARILKIKNYDF